ALPSVFALEDRLLVVPLGVRNFWGDGEARNQLVSNVCGCCEGFCIFVSELNVEGSLVGCLERCAAPNGPIAAPGAVEAINGANAAEITVCIRIAIIGII